MSKITRQQFADREDNLRKMRKNDPYQFDILYREYCRLRNTTPTANVLRICEVHQTMNFQITNKCL